MRRAILFALVALVAVVIIVPLVIAGYLLFIDRDIARRHAEGVVSETVGREVAIREMRIWPGEPTRIILEGLEVANWPDGRSRHLLKADRFTIALDPWTLLDERVHIRRLEVEAPSIALERTAERGANWQIRSTAEAAGEVAAPDERSELPVIDEFLISGGRISLRDTVRAIHLEGDLRTASGEAEYGDRLKLEVEGTLQDRPIELSFLGGRVAVLTDTQKPYPIDLDVSFGGNRVSASGELDDPFAPDTLALDMDMSGPNLAELYPLIGVPLAPTPPYSLKGRLTHEDEVWTLRDLEGRVGDSDLAGRFAIDFGHDPPFVSANLFSRTLDFDDLAGLVGADPDPDETASDAQRRTAERQGIFPDNPIEAEKLRALDADIRFEGRSIRSEDLPITALTSHLIVRNGRATLDPLTFEIADGTASGRAVLNGREAVPSAEIDVQLDDLDLRPFFQGTDFVDEMGGGVFGQLRLAGTGRTLDEILSAGRGGGHLATREGQVSGLMVEAAGLDVVEALALAVGEDQPVKIRCARVGFRIEDGLVKVRRAFAETNDSLLLADARVHLERKELEAQVEAREKDFSLIDLAAPVTLSGPFKDLGVAIGGVDPLPFMEMGETKDVDCKRLLRGAEPG